MAVKIGPKISIEGEKEYRDSINRIIQQSKTLDSEMKKLTSSFDKNGKSLKDNKQQRELLNQQIANQKTRISELNGMLEKSAAKYGEADTKTLKWKQAVNDATTSLNKMQAELREMPSSLELVGQKFESVGSKMKSIGGSISQVGKTLTTHVTMPIVGVAGAATKLSMEFEKEMSGVKAVAGATDEEFEQMRKAAIDMSHGTIYSAQEAAQALYYMGLAGWSAQESMAALPSVLNAAAAGNMDLGRASDIVTDYMTALKIPVDGYTNGIQNAEHFVNVLTATMTNSNTDIDMLGETFKYAGTTAGALGFSIEDLSIASGIMANNGIKASQAGTTLRNIMQRMAKPTDEVATAMDKLGISLDADGEMMSFLDIMYKMREGFQGIMVPEEEFQAQVEQMNIALENGTLKQSEYDKQLEQMIGDTYGAEQAQMAMYAAMLGGARGMAGLLAIANASDEEFDAFVQTIYNADEAFVQTSEGIMTMSEALSKYGDEAYNFEKVGAAQGVAETQMDNLSGDIKTLVNDIKSAGIEMASLGEGPMRDFVQKLNEWVTAFRELSPEQQAFIIKIAGIAAAVGPAIMVVGGLVSAIGTIGGAIGTLIPIIGTVISVAGPLLIGGAVIAGLIAGAMWLNDNWDMVSAKASEIWGSVVDSWNGLKEGVVQSVTELKDNISEKWSNIKETVGTKIDEIKTAAEEKWSLLKETVGTKLDELKTGAEEKWTLIKESASGTWQTISDTVSEKAGGIYTTVEGKLGEILAAYEEHNGGMDGVVAAGWQAIEEYYTLGYDTLNTLTDGKLGEIVGMFTENLGGLGQKALQWGKDIIANLRQGLEEKWAEVKEGASKLAEGIASVLHFSEPDEGPLKNFHTFMPDMVNLMVKGMDQNAWKVRQAAEGLAQEMRMALPPSRMDYEADITQQVSGLNATLTEKDTNVQVVLTGDAGRMLRVLSTENNRRTRATGYNALGGI